MACRGVRWSASYRRMIRKSSTNRHDVLKLRLDLFAHIFDAFREHDASRVPKHAAVRALSAVKRSEGVTVAHHRSQMWRETARREHQARRQLPRAQTPQVPRVDGLAQEKTTVAMRLARQFAPADIADRDRVWANDLMHLGPARGGGAVLIARAIEGSIRLGGDGWDSTGVD